MTKQDDTQPSYDPTLTSISTPYPTGGSSVPKQIGPYKIIRTIGEGGMGTVYEAEQENPKRTVALKVIRAGLASSGLLKRFELESQVLGRLQHPGIGQIYQAGTADTESGKRPYFAMEFVRGVDLRHHVNQKNLSTRERLDLLAKICDAVHHAHQKGVIHRDLKPGNILVDQSGQPKILDFGVARATDSDMQVTTMQTDVGQLIGTLQYMSPEQVAADPNDLDTRSDVYALGVIAYEMLTGQTPYNLKNKMIHEAARIIREDEPTALSSTNKTLRGDIETIVVKAMEKDKTRRYQSAAGLAEDVRRYLNDQPILARPQSAMYQLGKFAKRNKALAGGVVVAMTALVIGMTTSTYLYVQAETAREEAQQQAQRAEAVNEFLTYDLLGAVDPTRTQDRDITMREVLDEASLRITTRFKNQPFVAASVERTLGEVYTRLGVYSPAKKHLRRAYELLRTARGERDRETLSARRNLDTLLFHTGQYEQGIRQMEDSLAIMRDALGEDDYVTVCAMAGLGELYAWQNQFDKAEPILLLAITGLDKAVGPRHRHAMSARNNLAILYSDRRQFEKAEALLRSVYEGMRDEYGEEDPDTLTALVNIAHVYNQAGRLDEAEEIGRKLLETGRRTLGDEHPTTLTAMNNLAVTYMAKGQPELAEPLYVEDFETSRRIFGAEHPDTLTSMTNLGRLYTQMERFEDSVRVLTESAVLTKKVKPPGHFGIGVTLASLGEALLGLDRFEEAIPPLLEAYDVILPILGPEHRGIKKLIGQLTSAYEKTGNTQAAAQWRTKLPKEESNDGK